MAATLDSQVRDTYGFERIAFEDYDAMQAAADETHHGRLFRPKIADAENISWPNAYLQIC